VSETQLPSDEDRAMQEVAGMYDVPAYVRRARAVEGAFQDLLARCRAQKEEWAALIRLRVGQLFALAGTPEALQPLLADESDLRQLCQLHAEMAPELRVPVEPTRSRWALRTALGELIDSIERFNRRWEPFLLEQDLSYINELRDGYNLYYVLEKECAMRSPAAARQGFVRLEPLTHAELVEVLPPLAVPRLR
jgi:hypothetical protein